jgi:hypothetical protein
VEYISVMHQETRTQLTAIEIFSFDSCPSSREYNTAKTINFNHVIDEFASVKAKKLHCKFEIVHDKCEWVVFYVMPLHCK